MRIEIEAHYFGRPSEKTDVGTLTAEIVLLKCFPIAITRKDESVEIEFEPSDTNAQPELAGFTVTISP